MAAVDEEDRVGVVAVKRVKLTTFARDLRQSAQVYSNLLRARTEFPKANRHIKNLGRIKAFQSFTWLLDMFGRNAVNEKARIRLLRVLEAFMMRRHICEKRSNELETIFAALTAIDDENYEHTVLHTLREYTPEDEEFEAAFAAFPFVPAVIDRARYALEMLEYQAIAHKNEYYLADPDDLELEHIIPKAAAKPGTKAIYGDWPSYLGEGWRVMHTKMLHRIGNMTLLADELNVVASNNPFLAKRKEYEKSNIRLTQELTEYSQFKFKTVEARSKTLAALAIQIWKV
ncbi:hypothetical protein D3C86_1347670 [compost metagenome]